MCRQRLVLSSQVACQAINLSGSYCANIIDLSRNFLNLSALPYEAQKNIVACSPISPANRVVGAKIKSVQ